MSDIFQQLEQLSKLGTGVTMKFQPSGNIKVFTNHVYPRQRQIIAKGKDEAEIVAKLSQYLLKNQPVKTA